MTRNLRWTAMGLFAAAAVLGLATSARADDGVNFRFGIGGGGDHGRFGLRIDLGGHDGHRPILAPAVERVWVPPVYRTAYEQVWVEPEYRTVVDRVWREPVVNNVATQVLVPARYEERQVLTTAGWRRMPVLVAPAHYETRVTPVVVTSGRWELIERQELVCAGHWQTVARQELVAPGHFEYRPCP